jgi:hypothetical protein
MPEISRFFGLIIRMYWADHNPPHFHAFYGDDEVLIDIRRLVVIGGHIAPRALGLVIEWASLHQPELIDLWNKAQSQEPMGRIAPLT